MQHTPKHSMVPILAQPLPDKLKAEERALVKAEADRIREVLEPDLVPRHLALAKVLLRVGTVVVLTRHRRWVSRGFHKV